MISTLVIVALVAGPAQEDPAADAAAKFAQLDATAQNAIFLEIDAKLAASPDAGLKKLLALRDRARREMHVEKTPGPQFFAHSEFAPTQVPRALVAAASDLSRQTIAELHPDANAPQFCQRIAYDFARNLAIDLGEDPPPDGRLLDLLAGYVPGNDAVVAWLEAQLDWDGSLDKKADFFEHCYCDREGHAFPTITIFDAFASQTTIEMPDVDAIAYARRILKDNSYTSPIPADAHRTKLYKATSAGFLEFFQHRTLVEAFAWLYVNPDSILHSDHEGLRNRVLLAIALDGEDPTKIVKRLRAAKDRDGFVKQIDKLIAKDARVWDPMTALQSARLATRTAVCNAAWEVLDKHGISTPPAGGK